MAIMLRRRKLGRTSCREIARLSNGNITVVRNDLVNANTFNGHDTVIRWGCTADVPNGIRVINKASAIHEVNDKLGFRRILQEAGLCPMTWFSFAQFCEEKNTPPEVNMGFTVVVRPSRHAQGRNLHVCTGLYEVRQACRRYGEGNYYISELINKVAEYRVAVVQGRAAWVAQKTPGNPQDVAWNVARGGRFDNVRWDDWPLKAVRTAIEAFNLSSLDFGGVDVMVDQDGNCYILEINSAPSLTSPYRQECMSKCFNYILANGKERIPLVQERGGYRKFIHPAITDTALIGG